MPTASKVVAGLFFAALAYLVGDLVKPLLPEGTRVGLLSITLAVVGLLSGWRMSGGRAGFGTRAGFGYGMTTSVTIVFWGIFLFSGHKALQYSLDRRFDGPIEALQAMISFGIEFVVLLATPTILGTLLIGGLFGGWLTEWIAKRWS